MYTRHRPVMILFCGIPLLLYIVQFWHRYQQRLSENEPLRTSILDNFPEDSTYINSLIQLEPHIQENTTLFIGFSQNWFLLQQCIVSYISAGWPPSDIYIVDNTGTFLSNRHRKLSPDNPLFLDYNRLESVLGVNIIIAPTRLTFSQLQNLFLSEAINRQWSYFFWSHADVVALSFDRSLYSEAVADFRRGLQFPHSWGIRFYAYDRLALVSVNAFEAVGGWDTRIPSYPVDCDMYGRLEIAGYINPSLTIGYVFDVSSTIDTLAVFFNLSSVDSPTDNALKRNFPG